MNKRSLFAVLALAAFAATPQATLATPKTVTLSVPSMNCATCPITVRKALEKVPGVQKAKATLEPPEAVVTFDDAKTNVGALTKATADAGYPSTVKK